MGLGRGILQEVIDLKRSGALAGMTKVVEIGAQQLSNQFLRCDTELKEVCALFGQPVIPQLGTPIDVGHAGQLELQSDQAPPSQPFWEALGFEYSTIDFDGHRHSRPLDLNCDGVPDEWRNRFDLSINAGTTEHVANQDNAFRVMHDLVRPGGVMVHELPAAGMLTHGLVTYSIKFFWHLCRENNYEVLRLEMTPGGASPLPDNIVGSNARFSRNHGATECASELIRDWGISASLRKRTNAAFVTPLDLPPEVMPVSRRPSATQRLRSAWQNIKNG